MDETGLQGIDLLNVYSNAGSNSSTLRDFRLCSNFEVEKITKTAKIGIKMSAISTKCLRHVLLLNKEVVFDVTLIKMTDEQGVKNCVGIGLVEAAKMTV